MLLFWRGEGKREEAEFSCASFSAALHSRLKSFGGAPASRFIYDPRSARVRNGFETTSLACFVF